MAPKKDAKTGKPVEIAPVVNASTAAQMPAMVAKKPGFWKSLFSTPDEPAANEQRHDEPALGEA
jgi:hypothetical protein